MVSTTTRRAPQPARAPAERLPAPVRERRPALLALAVLLIVVGALVSALVVVRSGNKQGYLVLTHDLQPGQQVRNSDLGIATLAVGSGSGASGVPSQSRALVVGEYATARLYAGTLITGRMFTREQPVPSDAAVVGVVVASQQMPAGGIHAGDVVEVVQASSGVSGGAGGGPALTLVSAVRVTAAAGDSNSAHVSLLVPDSLVDVITAAAVDKSIVLVELPPTATPVIGADTRQSGGQDSATKTTPTAGSGA